MKKLGFIVLFIAIPSFCFGQITTTKVAPKTVSVDKSPYDGSKNFLGEDVHKYLGQELYLKGLAERLRKFGYSNFVIDYTKNIADKTNVYKCCDSFSSRYDSIAGKYFKVLEIIQHPRAKQNELLYGSKYFLKLEEKESKDIVYFEYDSRFEHTFPFIVVAFFEKHKSLVVGKEFVFADSILRTSTDITTGKVITTKTGQKWKCTDLTVEEKFYTLSLIIENPVGEKTTISFESVFGEFRYGRVYTADEADSYRQKFGPDIFDTILQGNVRLGMTKEMCKLSWGNPKSINETITASGKKEQWVYSDNYLYFENGVLTTIQ